jgi:hypothetical protein
MAMFSTTKAGWDALRSLLTNKYKDSTILGTMEAYCPEKDKNGKIIPGNHPVKYANDIAAAADVKVDTKISALTSTQIDAVMNAIATQEGFFDSHGTSKVTPKKASETPKSNQRQNSGPAGGGQTK